MTPEQLSQVILGGVGVALQLVFKYFPGVSPWFDGLKNKALVALGFDAAFGVAYFGLACSSLAAQLNIQLSCDLPGLFVLANAIFLIAVAQQTAYLFTRKG